MKAFFFPVPVPPLFLFFRLVNAFLSQGMASPALSSSFFGVQARRSFSSPKPFLPFFSIEDVFSLLLSPLCVFFPPPDSDLVFLK